MTHLAIAVLSGALLVGGPYLIVAALAGALPEHGRRSTPSTGLWTKLVDKLHRVDGRTAVALGVGLVLGLLVTVYTGWPVMLAAVPAGVVGLPLLLREPPQDEIRLLEALDRWVRGMIATMSTGKSITDAARLSVRHAPPLLAPHLTVLIKRLDDRWPPAQALHAMADALENPDSDAVLAALILSVQRGGNGASQTLHALADTIHDRLRALREIEAERSKPRAVVRQVTIIMVVILSAGLLFARDFFAPYGTPIGQAILATLLAVYVMALVMLRRMTVPRPRSRILRLLP